MSRFFIQRPIFACVLSIIIIVMGILSVMKLPVERYPDISPPTINVTATYSGASAQTVENSVTQLLEQQIKGIDHILYFSSTSAANGQSRISISFAQGTNADTAEVQVQNAVSQIISRLPQSVQQQGVSVTKAQGGDTLMVVGIYDKTGRMSRFDISDYLFTNLQDPISRLDGVGNVDVFGTAYAMRIWLDPQKLNQYGLMPSDIKTAILNQNVQVSAGEVGAPPTTSQQYLNAQVTASSQLQTIDQFNQIVVKGNTAGGLIYLKDVARVELGAESYSVFSRINGYPSSGMAITLAPGANALNTSKAVKDAMQHLEKNLPQGLSVVYPQDSTPFVQESIRGVVETLIEAVLLVVVVMYLFLQSWRATLVPAIAVPVVVLGTFAILNVLGMTINTLTLFALVLAIGLLVDDAIVVVENVERVMHEKQLNSQMATLESMSEITGAIVGITLVLTSVFIPMAFFSGSMGVIYRQFSLTIVSAMLLSAMVALSITPAMCAVILKPQHAAASGFFAKFNQWLDWLRDNYQRVVQKLIKVPVVMAAVLAAVVAVLVLLYQHLPTSFLPDEDQGAINLQFELPSGSPISKTSQLGDEIAQYFLTKEKKNLKAIMVIIGRNNSGSGQNVGRAIIALKDWSERKGTANTSAAIITRANKYFKKDNRMRVNVTAPSSVPGLGDSSGFEMWLRDVSGAGRQALTSAQTNVVEAASKDPTMAAVRLSSLSDRAQLHVDIDQKQVATLGLSTADINSTLSTAWGGSYVNDFLDRGRIKRVYLQGDSPFRSQPEDLAQWYVRGANGQMVSFASFSKVSWQGGPQILQRFNGSPAVKIQGASAAGYSSGDVMQTLQQLVDKYPDFDLAWGGLSFEENASHGQTLWLYLVSIGFVFLCLAALYESWSIPAAVMMVIPLGVIGAVIFTTLVGFSNDIYFQVALLVTIGLSCKNAILIVEFAAAAEAAGKPVLLAALEGARLRLRPILMTSMAFIAGVLPLVVATGAGAASRQEIGVSVVGGMLFGTTLAVLYVPWFFVVVRRLFGKRVVKVAPVEMNTDI